MPALVICGYRTRFGGDDLGQVSKVMIVLRLLQLIAVIPLAIATFQMKEKEVDDAQKTCIDDKYEASDFKAVIATGGFIHGLKAYLLEAIILCSIGILFDLTIRYASTKIGTPTEDIDKRNKVLIPTIYCKYVTFHAFNLYVFIHGAILNEFYVNCLSDDVMEDYGDTKSMIYNYFCIILGIQGVYMLFVVSLISQKILNSVNNIWKERVVKSMDKLLNTDNQDSLWYNRMDTFFFVGKFISFGGLRVSSQDYAYIARVLDDYFDDGGQLDIVFSDILVGLVALIQIQILKTVGFHQDIYQAKKKYSIAVATPKPINAPAQDSSIVADNDIQSFNSPSSYEKWFIHDDESTITDERKVNDESRINNDNEISMSPPSNKYNDSNVSINMPGDVEVSHIENNSSDVDFSSWVAKEDFNYEASNSNSIATVGYGTSNYNKISLSLSKQSFYFMIDENNNDFINNNNFIPSNNNVMSAISLSSSFQVKPLNKNNNSDVKVIMDGEYYMKFALAIYTWMIYKDKYPIFGLVRLIFHSIIDIISNFINLVLRKKRQDAEKIFRVYDGGESRPIFYYDNRIKWNELALKLLLEINDNNKQELEIIYAQFESTVIKSVYCIILDHKTKSIVIAIRGTQSMYDVVVDLQIRPVHLKDFGNDYGFDGDNEFGHDGFMSRAQWLHDDLNRHGILDELFLHDKSKYKEYKLKIIGHSLGAACSIVLSVMLRRKFPTLHCFAFCPPGCVFSDKTSSYCQQFVTSYVMNSDIIPRMSYQNLESLRDEVLELISRIKVPKSMVRKAFKSIIKKQQEQTLGSTNEMYYDINELCDTFLYPVDSIPESKFKKQIDAFKSLQEQRKRFVGDETDDRNNIRTPEEGYLTIPGKIVHVIKALNIVHQQHNNNDNVKVTNNLLLSKLWNKNVLDDPNKRNNKTEGKYVARWASRSDFDEILITSSMVADHMPLSVLNSLRQCASTFNTTATSLNDK